MPFADVSRLITGFIKIICQGLYILRQGQRISMAVHLGRIFSALQAGPCRPANRLTGKCILKYDAFLCKTVKVRGYIQMLAIAS